MFRKEHSFTLHWTNTSKINLTKSTVLGALHILRRQFFANLLSLPPVISAGSLPEAPHPPTLSILMTLSMGIHQKSQKALEIKKLI